MFVLFWLNMIITSDELDENQSAWSRGEISKAIELLTFGEGSGGRSESKASIRRTLTDRAGRKLSDRMVFVDEKMFDDLVRMRYTRAWTSTNTPILSRTSCKPPEEKTLRSKAIVFFLVYSWLNIFGDFSDCLMICSCPCHWLLYIYIYVLRPFWHVAATSAVI